MIQQGPAWPRMRELAPSLVYDLTLCDGGIVPRDSRHMHASVDAVGHCARGDLLGGEPATRYPTICSSR